MTRREKLDPSWHKSRIAARIWMKGLQGRRLTAREKRLARLFSEDRGVENRLIQQGIFYFIGSPYRIVSTPSGTRQLQDVLGTDEVSYVLGHAH